MTDGESSFAARVIWLYLDDPDTHYRLERLRDLTDLSSLVESR